jgi:serine/threonine protein phosphatase PrpC
MKVKPCNLTKEEWDFLLMVFDGYVENLDSSEDTVKILKEIHQKMFFMDYLIQQEGLVR